MSKTRKSVKVVGNVGALTGRRNRQETMLSVRKAKKEDAYATRRNLKANHPPAAAQTASRKELLLNLASRSYALLLGIQRPEAQTRQKSMRAFVYLLTSGVPPLFDETDSQHQGLWQTILAALPSFVAILNEELPDATAVQLHSDAAFALRFISSMDKADAVIASGAVPKLVQLFRSGISELQIQAAWCLGNIASASPETCHVIMSVCPPHLVLPHIRMATPSLRRAAVWLLRSLVEFPEVMEKSGVVDLATKQEMMQVLVSLVMQLSIEKERMFVSANGQDENNKLKQTVAIAPWRIFEISTGKPEPNDIAVVRFVREVNESTVEVMDVDVNFETGENLVFQAKKTDLRPLQVMDDAIGEDDDLEDEESDLLDEQVLTLCDSCWALVEMTLHSSDMVSGIVNAGMCPRLVELLYISQSSIILAPVLRLLGNIVSAEILYAQAVIDAKLLEVIPNVLTTTSRAVREEACWMLSNIAGGHEDQVIAMMNAPGVIAGLVEQMSWAEYGVKREATWAMCNIIVRANVEFIQKVVQMGVLQSFCPLLEEWEDPMVELVILEAIESLLQKDSQEGRIAVEESGCLAKIEELSCDQNDDVSSMASQLLDTWFDREEDEVDATLAPSVIRHEHTGESLNFKPLQSDVQFHFEQN
ncbi:importin alpha isoform 1 [Plasmopara halstedii]|uniref:Importin alpha isoform 1 n=1 Tax=Plasmopara halstedii TaxID=4781 RepID=A0A0P1ABU1_PLAHL|nr:importin alpha isoform 1 [Plasmopara halstedii]CEG37816.1 importin alpha isoform 1 [Plasmopara halstedii]|eukprot:XP_024574185.1 importin alpha isoform 1 [Plasmopara halstedii]